MHINTAAASQRSGGLAQALGRPQEQGQADDERRDGADTQDGVEHVHCSAPDCRSPAAVCGIEFDREAAHCGEGAGEEAAGSGHGRSPVKDCDVALQYKDDRAINKL